VDENYSGGGIGEYANFDTANGFYDYSGCNTNGDGNCKLIGCHDTSSENRRLLGVYMEASFLETTPFSTRERRLLLVTSRCNSLTPYLTRNKLYWTRGPDHDPTQGVHFVLL